MSFITLSGLGETTQRRRRTFSLRIAMMLVSAGMGVVILDDFWPIFWVIAMIGGLVVELTLKTPDEEAPSSRELTRVIGWSAAYGAVQTILPFALWMHGTAPGMASAAFLWAAFVFRNSVEASETPPVSAASVTPHAAGMLLALTMTMLSGREPGFVEYLFAWAMGSVFLLQIAVYLRREAHGAAGRRQAMDQARHAADISKLIFTEASASIIVLDRELRIVQASKRFYDRHGWAESDAVGRPISDVLPVVEKNWVEAYDRALAGESVRTEEEAIHSAEGVIYLSWQCAPWYTYDGQIGGVFIYSTDITPFVTARQEKEATNNRLDLALDITKAAVWELDFNARTFIGGDRLADLTGVRASYDDMLNTTAVIVHPEDRPLLQAAVDRAISQGQRFNVEHRIALPTGEVKWVQTSGEMQTGADGAIARLVGFTHDITQRKSVETGFVEAMRLAETSLEGKRALMSAIARDIGAPDALNAPRSEPARESLESGSSFEELYRRLNRLLGEIEKRDRALVDAVQALRDARTAAEAANVSKSQFLANMSHEFRTPLNAVIGYSEILEEDLSAAKLEESAKDAGRVRASARHLLSLINEVLDLSKIEAGKMDLLVDETDIPSLVSETAETMQPLARAKNNALTVHVEDGITIARTDAMRLRQCLLNLLSNAAKFTENGKISVAVRRMRDHNGSWIGFEVSDTGIGLSAEQIGRLFQPFVQADVSTTKKYGGTGLGLALTRRMAQLLGGDVDVESAVNKGSVFTLRIPAGVTGAGETTAPAADAPHGGRPVVLIVQNDRGDAEATRAAVNRLGFAGSLAETSAAGLAMAHKTHPALVVMDVDHPDGSGWTVLEALRADPFTAAIPIVALSSRDDRARAMALGAAEHLLKPADPDQLIAAAVRFARVRGMVPPAQPAAKRA